MHIYFPPSMLKTMLHIIFDVVRSDVQVVSSPGYLIRLPLSCHPNPVGIIFLWLVVYHHPCIHEYSIFWDVFNIIWTHLKKWFRSFGACFVVNLCQVSPLFSPCHSPCFFGDRISRQSLLFWNCLACDWMNNRDAKMFNIDGGANFVFFYPDMEW